MKNWKRTILSLCTLTVVGVFAYVSPGIPTGYVNDRAGLLNPEVKISLEDSLSAFAASSTHQISVLIVSDLDGESIESYAVRVFEEWKIGDKKYDNGALFIVSSQERKMRIEVGYGLEGVLTDAESHRILTEVVAPYLKENNYDQGVTAGVQEIIRVTSQEKISSTQAKPSSPWSNLYGLIYLLPFIGSLLARYLAESKSWWQGGVLGALTGGGFLMYLNISLWWVGAATVIGLLVDFFLSRSGLFTGVGYPGGGWGGFGGGSSGGFGGFGGGRSGGGGASSDF